MRPMADLTIPESQKLVDQWISQFEAGYWPPLSMLAAMMEEVGELAKEINSLECHKPKKTDDGDINIVMELGDILFALICLANYYDIGLEDALRKVMAKYDMRDRERWERIIER
ncbi:MAG: nucleotide pyrophosphohydrolase [ANME-2 cluster archaeon]|nr:nucleotide pyrophosphohydrolase [ANME-2 cluster archaeon]